MNNKKLYLVIIENELISVCTNYKGIIDSTKKYCVLRYKHELFYYISLDESKKGLSLIGDYESEGKNYKILKNYVKDILINSDFDNKLYVCSIEPNKLIDFDIYEEEKEGLEFGDNTLRNIIENNVDFELTKNLKIDLIKEGWDEIC